MTNTSPPNPDRARRIEALFDAALDMAPDTRSQYLDRACADDESLRDIVEALLVAEEQGGQDLLATENLPISALMEQADTLQDAIAIGQEFGSYRIEEILGRGGMGIVVRAQHRLLDAPVAIKFLHPHLRASEGLVARFLREAWAAAKLTSQHVTRIINVGTRDDGVPFIVMEYLAGIDLAALLQKHERLAPSFAVDLILQAGDALAEAHRLGIIHRDIKPSNFFVTHRDDGSALLKVLDFGISKAIDPADDSLTHSLAILGTPAYMPPEQMASSKYVDARSDIWSLGVTLYQLVSGRKPFESRKLTKLVMMVANKPMPSLAHVALPRGLEAIIGRCLKKDPGQRFQNIAELNAALTRFASVR